MQIFGVDKSAESTVNWSMRFGSVSLPGFHVTSWFDIFQTSVIAAFNDIQARTGTQKLWIGPNEHYFVYTSNFWVRDPYFEWFDHWLKGQRSALIMSPAGSTSFRPA